MMESKEKTFDDMNIPENILRGIYNYGFDKPSKIQQLAIVPIIEKKDLIAQSQSGTGKTGAFSIGVISRINDTDEFPQAIILCNTHELSLQTQNVITELTKYTKLKSCLCIGGINTTTNKENARKSQILIGTPGRLNEIVNYIDTKKITIFVIDEADELLSNEFLHQSKSIIKALPDTTQMCIFSATLPNEVLDITKNFMKDPVSILIDREKLTLDLITQFYIEIEEKYKAEIIDDLYSNLSINQCIIYTNSINKAEYLLNYLRDKKHEVDVLHSKLDSKARLDVMKRFRLSQFRVLISTDLSCRGIDVQQVSYVINYDLPSDFCSYLHRIGRSGRFNKKGIAINLVSRRNFRQMRDIEKYYKTKIEEMPTTEYLNNYLSS